MTVSGGVDTHKHTHYAAAIDEHGRLLDHKELPANDHGYRAILTWMKSHGTLDAIGVESTGSFEATLTRMLTNAGEHVIEVNRPNRIARRMEGKSDPRRRTDRSSRFGQDLHGDSQDQVRDG